MGVRAGQSPKKVKKASLHNRRHQSLQADHIGNLEDSFASSQMEATTELASVHTLIDIERKMSALIESIVTQEERHMTNASQHLSLNRVETPEDKLDLAVSDALIENGTKISSNPLWKDRSDVVIGNDGSRQSLSQQKHTSSPTIEGIASPKRKSMSPNAR